VPTQGLGSVVQPGRIEAQCKVRQALAVRNGPPHRVPLPRFDFAASASDGAIMVVIGVCSTSYGDVEELLAPSGDGANLSSCPMRAGQTGFVDASGHMGEEDSSWVA